MEQAIPNWGVPPVYIHSELHWSLRTQFSMENKIFSVSKTKQFSKQRSKFVLSDQCYSQNLTKNIQRQCTYVLYRFKPLFTAMRKCSHLHLFVRQLYKIQLRRHTGVAGTLRRKAKPRFLRRRSVWTLLIL